MSRGVRVTLGLCLFMICLAVQPIPAHAHFSTSNCTLGRCIDVLTDPITGEIIGLGTAVTPGTQGRRVTVTKKRTVKKSPPLAKPIVNPICTVDQLATFTCIKTAAQVVVVPPVIHAAVTPARPTVVSTDEVRRLLPRAQPGFQPSVGVVVNIPVIFWSGLATPARFTLTVLGHSVEINMSARFLWSWGDGTSLTTTSVGAPFPSQNLVHAYHVPGRYHVRVTTTWSGSANLGQAPLQIVGTPIESSDQLEIVVGEAPTKLTPAS
jgi:hypothetical protein